jgi:hypothetical protein
MHRPAPQYSNDCALSTKKPNTNSKSASKGKDAAPAQNSLFALLHPAAKKAPSIKFSIAGNNTKEFGVLRRLANMRDGPLSEHQTKSLKPYIDELQKRDLLDSKLKVAWEKIAYQTSALPTSRTKTLDDHQSAKLESDAGIVARYLRHIEEKIEKVRSDPILHRRALVAKARCLEFERRWEDLVSELYEIIRIEETLLKDPVEAARTRARTAEAYIEDGKDTSLASAKELLLTGIKGIEKNSRVWRTRLELLLSLAHVHLHLGEYAECQRLLTKQCKSLLAKLRAGANAACFPELAASYEVRMGVALKGECREMGKRGELETEKGRKKYTKDMKEARSRLIAGALLRAKLKHLIGTAHAIRHLGGIYALSDWGLAPAIGLPRALWFYRAAMAVFQNHGDKTNEVRTHFNCGKVSWRMWKKIAGLSKSQQTEALKDFGVAIGQENEGEEAVLVAEIQSSYASPHAASGEHPFARPYCTAAIAHYEAYLKAKAGQPETKYIKEARQHLAELTGKTAEAAKDSDSP